MNKNIGKGFSKKLRDYYTHTRIEFQNHLEREIGKETEEIAALIKKGVGEGKQLRPVLCRLVSDSLGGDAHLALECGMALELMHCGALIHDDWIDGDSFRRNAPSLWKELGPRTAVLVADLMVATGSLHAAISVATGNSLAKCARNLSEGAISDFTDKENFSESIYIKRIKMKTGALFGTAAELGVLVSPMTEFAKTLYNYGETIGIIYQITDDYLDLLNSIITQTPVGDLALGIPTLPLTRLSQFAPYNNAIELFNSKGDASQVIDKIKIKDAQIVFDDLIKPWKEIARKYIKDLPKSPTKKLLYEVPFAFSDELLISEKPKLL